MPSAKLAPQPCVFWLNKRGALYYDPLLDDGGPELRLLECDSGKDVKFVREIVVTKLVPYRRAKAEQGESEATAGKAEQRWISRFAERRRKWLEQLTAPGSEADEEARRLSEDAHELAGEVEVAVQEVAAEGYTELTGELDYVHIPEGEVSLDDEPPEPEMLEPEEGGVIGIAVGGVEPAAEAGDAAAPRSPGTAAEPAGSARDRRGEKRSADAPATKVAAKARGKPAPATPPAKPKAGAAAPRSAAKPSAKPTPVAPKSAPKARPAGKSPAGPATGRKGGARS